MKIQPKQAFTLIELLTVIAIIGILASILIPTVGRVRESARRTVDASNLRQIGQASLIYANDNRELLPGRNLFATGANVGTIDPAQNATTATSTTVSAYAAALARFGGINDAGLWHSASDSAPITNAGLSTVLNAAKNGYGVNFEQHPKSFAVVAGLTTGLPSTVPIAFTRGVETAGTKWANNRADSVYGQDGGHVVFLGGNVGFFKDFGATAAQGRLINVTNGERTHNIRQAIGAARLIRSQGGANLLDNTPGIP
jgi:prepilin-type N-terminal cleavage/methylation domain-containing protein